MIVHSFFGHKGPIAHIIGKLIEVFPQPIETQIIHVVEINSGSKPFADQLLSKPKGSAEPCHLFSDSCEALAKSFPNFKESICIDMALSKDKSAMIPERVTLPKGAEGIIVLFKVTCCCMDAVNAAVIYRNDDGTFSIHTVPSLTGRAISRIDGAGAWKIFDNVKVEEAFNAPGDLPVVQTVAPTEMHI